MSWYLDVLKKYAVFVGRARRKEYWMFVLFNLIIAMVLGFVDGMLGFGGANAPIGPLGGLYSLAVFLPSLAVSVRRLHDTGRSGWWLLVVFFPILGALVLLFFFVQDSQAGTNAYGPNPKESAAAF